MFKNDGLYWRNGDIGSKNEVAGFDLDWTLIRSIRGKFHKDEHDWKFLPNRIITLKAYRDAGYTIAIFTNQGYKGAKLLTAVSRVNNVVTALINEGINPWVFVATNNIYRKPNISMWQEFIKYNPNIDISKSFFTGDAASRIQDHSDNDIKFAENIGLSFYTPEEFFANNPITIPNEQTMFIFVGMSGSGKTSFYDEKLKPLGWIHANQDTLKTRAKVIDTVRNALITGKSVAVDATNPSRSSRKDFIDLAIQYNIPTLIIYFVRNGHGYNKLRDNPVPEVAYNMYYKNLEEPNENEGVPIVEIF